MAIPMYIIIAVLIVITIILSAIHSLLNDIQDDLQLIRMRAFTPKEEEPDVANAETNEDEKIGDKELMKALQVHSKDIRDIYNELEYIKATLKEHTEKLNEIYIEE